VAISFESWLAFLVTVFIMQLPPGPDSMLVLARGIGQGQRIDHRTGNPTLELLLLGLTQKLSGAVVLGAYAFSSSFMAKWLRLHTQAQLWTQRIAGAFIIGLAFYMLFIRRQYFWVPSMLKSRSDC
jgi:threonine/homoserine/homoserine lactone efflux protein